MKIVQAGGEQIVHMCATNKCFGHKFKNFLVCWFENAKNASLPDYNR